jgi:Protein of unknown function (DUF2934)
MTKTTIELFDPQLAARHSPDLPDASCTHPGVEHAWRQKRIRDAAYFRSLHRPAGPGKEVEDWLAAEREIDDVCAKRL